MAIAKKKNSNTGIWIGLVIGAVIVGSIATPMALAKRNTMQYQTATVAKEDIETHYTFTGSIDSKNSQKVMAEKILQISELKVSEGSKVKKGDVLFIAKDKTQVKAKVAGVVSKIYIEADEQVMSGTLLCEIYDFDHLQVTLRVDEFDLPSIKVGDAIDITINALEKEVVGKISDLSDIGVNQNGVAFFTATVDLDKDSEIKIGMTAEAKVINEQAKDALIIPVKALLFDSENNPYIYIKNSDGDIIKMGITVGIDDGKNAEIVTGVSQGMTVYYNESGQAIEDEGGFAPPMGRR